MASLCVNVGKRTMSSSLPPQVLVPDEFRPHAKLVLIGEAPWKSEAERGYPFAGWSGLKLREMWGKVGLRREDFSILNVYGYPRKPETVKPDTMLQWVERLHKSLACHTDPYVLVPVGNLALWALTGKSYPPWDKPKKGEFARAGIQKLRGSVLTYNDRLGRKVKVVPSVHPAALARQPGLERACLHDWERVRAEMGFKEVRKIKRDLRVAETVEEVQWWVQEWMKKGETVTFDIENPSGKTIMIGFSSSSSSAVTVPTTASYWKSEIACETVWRSLSCFLQSDVPKCGQNVSYDIESLYWERGIQVRNVLWDTANMYHCLDATEGKYDLAYLASVHTNEEFWKDECVLGDVEALTKCGWVPLNLLGPSKNVEIAQYDLSTDKVSFVNAEIIERQFSGSLIRAVSKQHDCFYTPNHRLPEIQKTRKVIYRRERSAQVAATLATFNLPTAGYYQDGRKRLPWIRLLVAIQADAALRKGNHAVFTLKKERKIERLLALCRLIGVSYRDWKAPTGYRVICLTGPIIRDIAKCLKKEKRFGSWLLECDEFTQACFLDELRYWDGWNDPHSKKAHHFCSEHLANVEWVATIAALRGMSARIRRIKHAWCVTVKDRPHTVLQKRHFSWHQYKGPVYCAKVPSGFFLIRSAGHISVTGNCKDPEESKKYVSNMQAFYRYNGLDAAVTHELYEKGRVKLQELGLEQFYLEHYGYIQDSLVELATTGIQVDEAMRKWRWADLMAERFEVQDQLREVVGEDLCAKKSLSPTRLQRFLYESLRLPKKYKRVKGKEEKSVTTDESAILALMQEHPQVTKLQEAGKLILRLRFLDAREKYYTDKLTRGGRMYSKYSPRTEEGRLSSSASNQRTEEGKNIGMNAQNIAREIRDLFIAG